MEYNLHLFGSQRRGWGIERHVHRVINDLPSLVRAVEGAGELLIVPHNDPDPDAIASSAALQWILEATVGLRSHIAYRGIIGRAENKALVRYLGHPLTLLASEQLTSLPIALVDTQPGAGNNVDVASLDIALVFDHHPLREETSIARFVDVRPEVGSTSTILTEYCQAVDKVLPSSIVTALFYGIKTDTMGLGREAAPEDVAAYFYLQSRIDVKALGEIERAQVPPEYFKGLVAALRSAQVYDDKLIISTLEEMQRPDLPAEIADLLLRMQGINWVICMGVYKDDLMLSVRTNKRQGAGRLIQDVVGALGSAGGHGTMSAGQIPLDGRDPQALFNHLERRALAYLGVDPNSSGEALT